METEEIQEINENDLELGKVINKLEMPEDDYKEAPIQLIEFEGQTFKVNEEAIKLLKLIEEDIIVVSIVGKARTGKSYLMNLLLDNIGKPGVNKITIKFNYFSLMLLLL